VPEFGPYNSGKNGYGDHANCVGVNPGPFKAPVHDEGSCNRGEPEHQAKGGNVEVPKMDVRNHSS
jgi:hypothetical protein